MTKSKQAAVGAAESLYFSIIFADIDGSTDTDEGIDREFLEMQMDPGYLDKLVFGQKRQLKIPPYVGKHGSFNEPERSTNLAALGGDIEITGEFLISHSQEWAWGEENYRYLLTIFGLFLECAGKYEFSEIQRQGWRSPSEEIDVVIAKLHQRMRLYGLVSGLADEGRKVERDLRSHAVLLRDEMRKAAIDAAEAQSPSAASREAGEIPSARGDDARGELIPTPSGREGPTTWIGSNGGPRYGAAPPPLEGDIAALIANNLPLKAIGLWRKKQKEAGQPATNRALYDAAKLDSGDFYKWQKRATNGDGAFRKKGERRLKSELLKSRIVKEQP